jgi:Stress responsive A/B Barrel Domain
MKIIAIVCALLISGMIMTANAAERLQHVVCFKFKSSATAEEIKKVETAFEGLKKKIPQVVTLEWGTNVSKEQRDKGFTHCFLLSFKSERDRDAYIEHPEHKAFGKIVGPVLDDVFVIDYWAKVIAP